MMKLAMATGVALALGLGAAAAQTTSPGTSGAGSAMQMTQAECQSLWSKIDAQNTGSASQTQVQQYVKDFKSADANSDGRLSSSEFQNACQRGLVQSAATGNSGATGTGSGTTGSGATGGSSR